jgi:hypothetical protein
VDEGHKLHIRQICGQCACADYSTYECKRYNLQVIERLARLAARVIVYIGCISSGLPVSSPLHSSAIPPRFFSPEFVKMG